MSARRKRNDAGFTMLEVMVALAIAMIGLLGTVAVQQATLRATQSAGDASTAMRLATQRMEQFNVATTSAGPPIVDELAARAIECAGTWSTAEFVDASGQCATGTQAWTAACRWKRQWMVRNLGAGQPYNISVQVTYDMDGNSKVLRVDTERRKSF